MFYVDLAPEIQKYWGKSLSFNSNIVEHRSEIERYKYSIIGDRSCSLYIYNGTELILQKTLASDNHAKMLTT